MNKTYGLLLGLTVLLAFILRIYKFTVNPPSLYWDEASIAYNAYSLLQTGKDEWGIAYPLTIKSFGDFKLPLYVYAVAVSEKVFGLKDFAVRFPSVLAGTATVALIFYLVRQLFPYRAKLALLSALFLAVSPWHIQFSRAGFEANLALFFLSMGILFFLLAVRENINYLFASAFSLVLCFYTYLSPAVTIPLVFLGLSMAYARKLLAAWKTVLVAILLAGILLWPYLQTYVFSPEGGSRFRAESVQQEPGDLLTNVVNNYVANFSSDYLFFKGDQEGRHSVKKIGELYIWQLPAVLAGAYLIFRRRGRGGLILILLILSAALPVALTRVSPHALRGLDSVIGWQILSAIGMVFLLSKFPLVSRPVFMVLFVFAFLVYLHIYFIHYPKAYAPDWQDGSKQLVSYLKRVQGNYGQIFITQDLNPVYLALYLPYDPLALQRSGHNLTRFLDKYYIVDFKTEPTRPRPLEKSLAITPSWMGIATKKELAPIRMVNGDIAFRVYEY